MAVVMTVVSIVLMNAEMTSGSVAITVVMIVVMTIDDWNEC
jgi:hypothetical protein